MLTMGISLQEFTKKFEDTIHSNQFTKPALKELFDYYNLLSEYQGESIELDVIAICCEWTEYNEYELIDKFAEDDNEELEDIFHRLAVNYGYLRADNGNYLVGNG